MQAWSVRSINILTGYYQSTNKDFGMVLEVVKTMHALCGTIGVSERLKCLIVTISRWGRPTTFIRRVANNNAQSSFPRRSRKFYNWGSLRTTDPLRPLCPLGQLQQLHPAVSASRNSNRSQTLRHNSKPVCTQNPSPNPSNAICKLGWFDTFQTQSGNAQIMLGLASQQGTGLRNHYYSSDNFQRQNLVTWVHQNQQNHIYYKSSNISLQCIQIKMHLQCI